MRLSVRALGVAAAVAMLARWLIDDDYRERVSALIMEPIVVMVVVGLAVGAIMGPPSRRWVIDVPMVWVLAGAVALPICWASGGFVSRTSMAWVVGMLAIAAGLTMSLALRAGCASVTEYRRERNRGGRASAGG